MDDDCFDIDNLRIDADALPERRAVVPRKFEKRHRHFVKVPWAWVEALSGASGQTWHLAIQLLYLHWKGKGAAIKLADAKAVLPRNRRAPLLTSTGMLLASLLDSTRPSKVTTSVYQFRRGDGVGGAGAVAVAAAGLRPPPRVRRPS